MILLQRDLLATVSCGITSERFSPPVKLYRLQIIEQGCESLFLLARQNQIIALFKKWNKVEALLARRGLQTKTGICLVAGNQNGGFALGVDQSAIAIDLIGWDVNFAWFCLEPTAGSRRP